MLLGKLKTSNLTDTDDKLVEMIMKAKKDASTSSIAGKLEAAQLEKWLNEKKTAADVFKLLKLKEDEDLAFKRPNVRAWVDYVDKLDGKRSDDMIVSVLNTYYADNKLALMVSVASGDADDMATKFEGIILKKWLGEKKSADDVFSFMLKRFGNRLFENPNRVNAWVSYVKKVDKEDPYKTMFLVLKKHFNREQLGIVVSDAATLSSTKELGLKLIQEMWLSESLTAKGVFNKLNLNDAGVTLFQKPGLARWVSFVEKLNPKSADEMMLDVLQSSYSKKQLAKMISAAKEVDETKEFATRLENQLRLRQGE